MRNKESGGWLQVLLPGASMACKAPARPKEQRQEMAALLCPQEPVLSTALLPPDEA